MVILAEFLITSLFLKNAIMKRRIIYILLLIMSITVLLNIGCKKNDLDGYNYVIERNGSSSHLIFFEYSSKIYGLDTVSNSVDVVISITNMEIGGVAKLPSGGIAITSRGNTNNHLGSGKMYITDNKYNVIKTVNICNAPVDPKNINDDLLIGSTGINDNRKYPLQIYNSNTIKLKRELLFDDFSEAFDIQANNDYYFIGKKLSSEEYCYLVQIDKEDYSTKKLTMEIDFFKDVGLKTYPTDSIIYIFNVTNKNMCKYDLNQQMFKDFIKLSEYPEISSLNAKSIFYPKVSGSYIFGLVLISSYPEKEIAVFKFNMISESFVFVNRINLLNKYGMAASFRLHGNRLYIPLENYIQIIDYNKGSLIKTVLLN